MQILVAGTGSQATYLEKLFESNGDVKFLGSLDDAAGVYTAGDVHIFSSTGAGRLPDSNS